MFGMKTFLYVVLIYGSVILTKCNDLDVEETKPNVIKKCFNLKNHACILQTVTCCISWYVFQVCVDCGTELINEEESLLFISTLDGTFIGVDRRKGKILWKFKEGLLQRSFYSS